MKPIISLIFLLMLSICFASVQAQNFDEFPKHYQSKMLKADVAEMEEIIYRAMPKDKKLSEKKLLKKEGDKNIYYFDRQKRSVKKENYYNNKIIKFETYEYGNEKILSYYGADRDEIIGKKIFKFDEKDRLVSIDDYESDSEYSKETLYLRKRSQFLFDDKAKSFIYTETEWAYPQRDSIIISKYGTLNSKGEIETFITQFNKEENYSEINYKNYNDKGKLTESRFVEYFVDKESGLKDSSTVISYRFGYNAEGILISEQQQAADIHMEYRYTFNDKGLPAVLDISSKKGEEKKSETLNFYYSYDSKDNPVKTVIKRGKRTESVIIRKYKYF